MKHIRSTILCLTVICVTVLSSCNSSDKMIYYSEKENYISSTGVVDYVQYTDDGIYIGFSELDYEFDDTCFKIVGENVDIVQKNNIENKLKMGSVVTIVTAPKYFGDGYVMPIVSIIINDTVLLDFEQGHENLLKWLQCD